MKKAYFFAGFQAAISLAFILERAVAAVPPAEKILPDDTLLMMAIPDSAKARAAYKQSAGFQLWRDPSMKPFVDKFMTKLRDDVIQPLERELGIRFADYTDLAQGVVLVGVAQNGWTGDTNQLPAWVFALDAKDRSDQLKTHLADVRKKWVDAGKKSRSETIRDVEFTSLFVSNADLSKTLDKIFGSGESGAATNPESAEAASTTEILIGQSGSLLLAGNDARTLEKTLVRLSGDSLPVLGDQALFQGDYQARFRSALVYGWIQFKPIADILSRWVEQAGTGSDPSGMMPAPAKILNATGVAGVRTLSFAMDESPEGSSGEFSVAAPASSRAGLFRLVAIEGKDSHPPGFVPADVMNFQRSRLDLQKTWNALETLLVEVSPQFGGVLKLMFDTAGKDKDPNFDLRKDLIGNLGDDLISYDQPPRDKTLQALVSPPSLFLVGSPNADKLASALRMITSLLPPPLNDIQEREFLGRKVYSVALPAQPPPDGSAAANRTLSYASANGYMALSTDSSMVEGFLRSGEGAGKSLSETPGLAAAAERVGGMSTGLFGYQNINENMRASLDVYKNDPEVLNRLISASPLARALEGRQEGSLKDWLDFSLLPPYERISRYFYFSVQALKVSDDGVVWKLFFPVPPQLKQ